MKRKPRRKHHYLPRYYLGGFVDSEGSFFVYDKQTDKIFPTSPDAAFFKNDLNTLTLADGSPSDFLESLYTGIENQSWNSLDRIRNSTPNTPIDLLDKMNLFFFLSFLHRRLPSNAEFAERLSERFFGPDNELSYFKIMSRTGNTAPKEIMERIRSSPAWKKAAKTVVPFAPFFRGGTWRADLENWRFLYSGDEYENGDRYVPEMLISVEAMKGALSKLCPLLAEAGVEPPGVIVIVTVAGDLHDIGKDLVAMMLDGAEFEVINLGVEVTAEAFVQAVKEHNPNILAMSALLTTTMIHTPEVIEALEEAGLREQVKVIVGGAPLTQEYANKIGADGYAPDAGSASKLAASLC